MEDAQVKSGNGLVDRSKSEDMEKMHGISVADYAKMLSEQGYSQAAETIDKV